MERHCAGSSAPRDLGALDTSHLDTEATISRFTPARSLATFALTALCAAAFAGCGNDVPPSAVAKVGDSAISKEEFDRWYENAAAGAAQSGQAVAPDPPDFEKCVAGLQKQPQPEGAEKPTEDALKKQCEQQYEELRDQVMQFLIQAQWVQQEAEARGISVSDEEVKKSFDDQKKKAFPKEADYKKFLEENGMSEEDILFQVKLDQLQTKLTKKITEGKATPTDEEIAAEYEKNKKTYAVPESRNLKLVLTKSKAKADEAKEALQDGDSFKKVAKELSIDAATKRQGGDLIGITRGQQDRDLEEAAFGAKKGELEGPVKAQFGYYVFKVSKIKPASQSTLEEVKDQITQQLRSTNEQKVLNEFIKDFSEKYKEKTKCADEYRIAECDNAPEEEDTNTGPASGGAPGTP
ncbi:MAG: peptidyl-prolyl cis-trans isomerase, partial [Actinomycetota bacterium]|nr:peptidyl-prolyl cis-trans isomerase [Actinomycetota bacterium]